MMGWKKRAAAAALAVSCLCPAAAAASGAEQLLYGAAAMLYVSKYYSALDNEAQDQFYEDFAKETGVCEDPEINARVRGIYEKLKNSGEIKRDYKVYVAPSEEINAFMSLGGVMGVNKGTADALDDDELAYVMAHELAHGEKRHSLSGVKKQVGLATALNVYLSSNPTIASELLVNVAGNYVSKAVFTKDQEKEADDLGFKYLTAAGFNPGGAAASMQVLYERYGDNAPSGIQSLIQPSDHPGTSERVKKNTKRMYEYSDDHVNVKDGNIEINGKPVITPQAMGNLSAEVRSFLAAGKLAALYHDGKANVAVLDGSVIRVAGVGIYTVSGEENGKDIVQKMNEAMKKES